MQKRAWQLNPKETASVADGQTPLEEGKAACIMRRTSVGNTEVGRNVSSTFPENKEDSSSCRPLGKTAAIRVGTLIQYLLTQDKNKVQQLHQKPDEQELDLKLYC